MISCLLRPDVAIATEKAGSFFLPRNQERVEKQSSLVSLLTRKDETSGDLILSPRDFPGVRVEGQRSSY